MNKYQILSLIIILIFFSSLSYYLISDKYTDTTDNTIIDDNNIPSNNTTVVLEFFTNADECEYCDQTKEILDNEIIPYFKDNITIYKYLISDNINEYTENREKLKSYGLYSTPSIIIINTSANKISKFGFSEISTDNKLRFEIQKHLDGNYSDTSKETNPTINFLGLEIESKDFSLPVLTIILAGIDSVNPCSFFVLLFLLSLLIYTKSRQRMIIIGSVFVFFSGFIYFLLMVGVGSIIKYVGMLALIFIIAGILALIFGGLNIKDFFLFKKGPSASISDEKKKGLYKQIRKIVKIRSIPSLFIASIIFAISANTVDLLCSFNLPVIYTAILSSKNLGFLDYYLYIFAYNLIYVIPLMIIVILMVVTLGRWKLSEFQGRVLKLFSGLIIFSLGLTLLINPNILNNLFTAIALVIVSIILTWIIAFIYKKSENSINLG